MEGQAICSRVRYHLAWLRLRTARGGPPRAGWPCDQARLGSASQKTRVGWQDVRVPALDGLANMTGQQTYAAAPLHGIRGHGALIGDVQVGAPVRRH